MGFLILEKEPIKCQVYEIWAFLSCFYRAVNLKTEMPGGPSTQKSSDCRSRHPGSPGIVCFGLFCFPLFLFLCSWSRNKQQYHPSQPHKSGKSFNCPVFTFPSFTATTVFHHSTAHKQWRTTFLFLWVGNLKGKLIFQCHPMNRWHNSELWAVFRSPEQQLEYGFIPTNKTSN